MYMNESLPELCSGRHGPPCTAYHKGTDIPISCRDGTSVSMSIVSSAASRFRNEFAGLVLRC